MECFNSSIIILHLIDFTFTGTLAPYLSMFNTFSLNAAGASFVQSRNTPITWGRYVSTRDNTMLDIEPTPGVRRATPSMTNDNGFGIFFARVDNTTVTTIMLKNDGKILIGNLMFWLYLVSRSGQIRYGLLYKVRSQFVQQIHAIINEIDSAR